MSTANDDTVKVKIFRLSYPKMVDKAGAKDSSLKKYLNAIRLLALGNLQSKQCVAVVPDMVKFCQEKFFTDGLAAMEKSNGKTVYMLSAITDANKGNFDNDEIAFDHIAELVSLCVRWNEIVTVYHETAEKAEAERESPTISDLKDYLEVETETTPVESS